MKNTRNSLFAVILITCAALAHATTPTPTQPIGVGLALSGSLSVATADGGDATGIGKSKADAKVGDITVNPGGSPSKDAVYVLPAPVSTLVPQAMSDCTKTDSSAGAFLWNGVSGSSSKQSAELFCAGLRLADRYEFACQYLSADVIRNRLAAFLFPGADAMPAQSGLANLTTEQCAVVKAQRR